MRAIHFPIAIVARVVLLTSFALPGCQPEFPRNECAILYADHCENNPDVVVEIEIAIRQDGQARILRLISTQPRDRKDLADKAIAKLIKEESHPRDAAWVGVVKYPFCERPPVDIQVSGKYCPDDDELEHDATAEGYRVLKVERTP